MNRIDEKFVQLKKDNKKAFIPFLVAGAPDLETTEKMIIELVKQGADIIEIGIPFSDPSADVSVVMEAYNCALEYGIDVYKVFEFIGNMTKKVEIPIVLLTYYNVLIQYGVEQFFVSCSKAGIDAVIIPDLPYEESNEIKECTERYGIYQIQYVSATSDERVKSIVTSAKGYLYCIEKNADELIDNIRKYSDIPICVGVSNKSKNVDGIIWENEIVEAVSKGTTQKEKIKLAIEQMQAINKEI